MTNEWWQGLAHELGQLSGVAVALTIDHVPDKHGKCQGCATHSITRVWPCSLRTLAETACRAMAQERDADGYGT